MEFSERDLAMGSESGGLGPDSGEVVTDPTLPEPDEVPLPPLPTFPDEGSP